MKCYDHGDDWISLMSQSDVCHFALTASYFEFHAVWIEKIPVELNWQRKRAGGRDGGEERDWKQNRWGRRNLKATSRMISKGANTSEDFKEMKGSRWRRGKLRRRKESKGQERKRGEVRRHTWVFRGLCPSVSWIIHICSPLLAVPAAAQCSLQRIKRKKRHWDWRRNGKQCSSARHLIAVIWENEDCDLTDECSWIKSYKLNIIVACVCVVCVLTFAAQHFTGLLTFNWRESQKHNDT